MKHIILCADDYGQNSSISQAIIALIEKNRLSATSCLTTATDWPSHSEWLIPLKERVDIGLHFNLTEGLPLSRQTPSFLPLSHLLIRSQLRRLDQSAIEAECHAQIDKFVASLGQLPDFIDGHQHIHQFPVIREAVLAVYEERLRANKTYIRCTDQPGILSRMKTIADIKQLIIQLSGAGAFKRLLIQRNIPHNFSFSGVYDFAKLPQYAKLFPAFLSSVQNRGLIMCHPGVSYSEADVITKARQNEYQYFDSQQFLLDCEHVKIVRFSELAH